MSDVPTTAAAVLEPSALGTLIDVLRDLGFRVIGPTVRSGTVVLAELAGAEDLPHGTGDEQRPGRYTTTKRPDGTVFGYAAALDSAKQTLFPADALLWRGRRSGTGFTVTAPADPGAPVALLGLKGCDLAAVGIHDEVLMGRAMADADYAGRRAATFIVAVTCGTPAETCFCTSMGTGPKPGPGADLVLTELAEPHRFLAEAGSDAGAQVLAELPTTAARAEDSRAAEEVVAGAQAAMTRSLRTDDLVQLLPAAAESPHWNDVAERCLACGNCTAVCPTCFCTTVEDVVDLPGEVDERRRLWDSCFSFEYSRLHGGAVRTSTASRYRQWLTHKLAAWVEQFGTSGCVGCGRCITWCPASIDLTAEVAALRAAAPRPARAQAAPAPAEPARPEGE